MFDGIENNPLPYLVGELSLKAGLLFTSSPALSLP